MSALSPSQDSSGKITVQIDATLEDLIPNFLANRERDVTTLRDALSQENFQAIHLLGHRLKGDGGGYGFEGISQIGGVIEAAALRRDADSIAQQTTALADYLARLDITFVA